MLLPPFVPCQQDVISVRFFACSISVRAYRTALACKVSMRRCAALRRPTRFGLFCTCKFHECGGISQCVFAAQRLHLSVYGRRSNRYAHCISARTCSADWHCTPRRPRLSLVLHSWDHYIGVTADGSWCTSGGVCVRLRCAAFATRPTTVESLRPFTCQCNGICAETIAASRPARMQVRFARC
jgi:hypothetical protein